MMPWGTLLLHVVAVSVLSNLGKLVPLFFYRDRKISERLAALDLACHPAARWAQA